MLRSGAGSTTRPAVTTVVDAGAMLATMGSGSSTKLFAT